MYKEQKLIGIHEDDRDIMYGCFSQVLTAIITAIMLVFMLSLVGALQSCRSKKSVVVQLRDSLSTHVTTSVVYVTDTQYVSLPPQYVERTTPDTASILSIISAKSTAAIRGGLLFHSLESVADSIPVKTEHKETVRDSIVYIERKVPVPVPEVRYVEKKLTWWQDLRLHLANIVIMGLLICVTFRIVKWRVTGK